MAVSWNFYFTYCRLLHFLVFADNYITLLHSFCTLWNSWSFNYFTKWGHVFNPVHLTFSTSSYLTILQLFLTHLTEQLLTYALDFTFHFCIQLLLDVSHPTFLSICFDSITMQNKQLKFPVFFWSRNSMQRITRMTIRVMPTAVHILLSQIYMLWVRLALSYVAVSMDFIRSI